MTKSEFLTDLDNFSNHRILLWEALQLIDRGSVIEFGSGHGSTTYLQRYCDERPGLFFQSFDSNEEWASITGADHVTDWESVKLLPAPSLLFLDHAPGERRQFDLVKYANTAKIIVIHDSEPTGGGDYRVRQHFPLFKSVVEVETEGAWATMLSNFVDLSPCVGKERITEKGERYVISSYGE